MEFELNQSEIENFNYDVEAKTFKEIHLGNVTRAYLFGLAYTSIRETLAYPDYFDSLLVKAIPYLEDISAIQESLDENKTLLDFVEISLNTVKLRQKDDIYLIAFLLGRYCENTIAAQV